jgi:DNA polymerase-3 subunit delta
MENLYLISGEDEFSKNEYLNNIKSKFSHLEKGINYLLFDKDNIGRLSDELSTFSFFDDKRLIIVKVPKTTRKGAEEDDKEDTSISNWYTPELETSILDNLDNSVIVFIEEGSSKGKMYKFFNANGTVILCDKLKPMQLQKWICEECRANNVLISNQDASYLTQICGNNKQRINNELIKLFNYIDNGRIEKKDIDKISIKTPETLIFDLTDGIGQRRPDYALDMLEKLLEQKEPIQKILVMITRHFKNLLLVKLCLNRGNSVEQKLGIKSYPAMKYTAQCKNFTVDELVSIFKKLAKLDINSKTINSDLKVGIQKIIME